MRTRDLEKQIRDVSQVELLSGAVSALNRILIEKRIVTRRELQYALLTELKLSVKQRKSKR